MKLYSVILDEGSPVTPTVLEGIELRRKDGEMILRDEMLPVLTYLGDNYEGSEVCMLNEGYVNVETLTLEDVSDEQPGGDAILIHFKFRTNKFTSPPAVVNVHPESHKPLFVEKISHYRKSLLIVVEAGTSVFLELGADEYLFRTQGGKIDFSRLDRNPIEFVQPIKKKSIRSFRRQRQIHFVHIA